MLKILTFRMLNMRLLGEYFPNVDSKKIVKGGNPSCAHILQAEHIHERESLWLYFWLSTSTEYVFQPSGSVRTSLFPRCHQSKHFDLFLGCERKLVHLGSVDGLFFWTNNIFLIGYFLQHYNTLLSLSTHLPHSTCDSWSF